MTRRVLVALSWLILAPPITWYVMKFLAIHAPIRPIDPIVLNALLLLGTGIFAAFLPLGPVWQELLLAVWIPIARYLFANDPDPAAPGLHLIVILAEAVLLLAGVLVGMLIVHRQSTGRRV